MTSIDFAHESRPLAAHSGDEKIARGREALRTAARIGLTLAASILVMAALLAVRTWVFWPASAHLAQ